MQVVLMKAEALNELDQTGPAIILLNDIRRRAQLPNYCYLKAQVRTAIYKERRVELAFEHDRFYDLVHCIRCCRIYDSWKNFVTGKHDCFCLSHSLHRQTDYLHKIQII
jgi:hypothetical protein